MVGRAAGPARASRAPCRRGGAAAARRGSRGDRDYARRVVRGGIRGGRVVRGGSPSEDRRGTGGGGTRTASARPPDARGSKGPPAAGDVPRASRVRPRDGASHAAGRRSRPCVLGSRTSGPCTGGLGADPLPSVDAIR